jgi:hypothetical protein
MGVLDRGVVGRLVPPALPPVVPEAPLRRLVLAAAMRDLAAVVRAAGAGLEDTVWAVTVRAGVSTGVAVAAAFAGAAVAGAGMAVTGVVAAAAGAALLADAFGAAALAALAWAALVLAAAARDRGVAMAEGDGARRVVRRERNGLRPDWPA